MLKRLSNLGFRRLLIRAGVIISSVTAVTIYADERGVSYRELIVIFALAILGVIVFGGESGIRWGFVLWVLTLALGYRTVSVTKELPLHPSEILLWLLLACICVQRRLVANARLTFPVWLWLFIPFCVLAWWPLVSISGGLRWDRMLNEFRNFVLLIPLMIVAPVVLQEKRYWRHLLAAFFIMSSFIAFLGTLEYWFPNLVSLFPEFIGKAYKPTITEEGFVRAQFAFWGSASATFICVLAVPAVIVLGRWWARWWQRTVIGLAAGLQIVGIYIGGYRSMWLIVLIQVITACLLRLRKQGAILAVLFIVISVGGYQLLPRTTERAMSGIAALQLQPTDSSAAGRKTRALDAVEATVDAPFGGGWSRAGWVHSDFLQVAVNLGFIPAFIFLGGCIYTGIRLARRVLPKLRRHEDVDFGLSLMVAFIGVGGILAMEGVSVLPQSVLPVWFVWVLADVWLRQTADAPEANTYFLPLEYQYRLMPLQASSNLNREA